MWTSTGLPHLLVATEILASWKKEKHNFSHLSLSGGCKKGWAITQIFCSLQHWRRVFTRLITTK